MLILPESIDVKRNKKIEAKLIDKARDWIESEDRSPGIHASELLDPRLAYWRRKKPMVLPDRLVNTFLVGKVLHAFVIGVVEEKPIELKITDAGSRTCDELGIEWSPDFLINGKVRELKTSRSFYPPKTVDDIAMYIEQALVYMAATDTLESQVWVLYLNLRDEEKRTSPEWRAYDITITKEDLKKIKSAVRKTRIMLQNTLETDEYRALPLCRDWLCSERMCEYWKVCKPEGRYNNKDWGKKK